MSFNIFEGLKSNTLEHLILPMVSIDEYESKIDDQRVIVVGFFVFDKDPAEDLSAFIDKSSSKILDTEVSPAPTPEGYYVVFVEILRDGEFPKTLMQVLDEIENLCDITSWQMQCLGNRNPIELTDETIREYIELNPDAVAYEEKNKKKNQKKKKNKAKISESEDFWLSTDLDKVLIENDLISFYKNNNSWTYQLSQDIPISNINLLEATKASFLQSLLGQAYDVYQMQDALVVEHENSVRVLKSIS